MATLVLTKSTHSGSLTLPDLKIENEKCEYRDFEDKVKIPILAAMISLKRNQQARIGSVLDLLRLWNPRTVPMAATCRNMAAITVWYVNSEDGFRAFVVIFKTLTSLGKRLKPL